MENFKIKNYDNGIMEMFQENEAGEKYGKYFKYENGRIREEGEYTEDKKEGKWIYYNIDQDRCLLQKEEHYKNGELDGAYKEFHLYGGIKEEGEYKEGKEVGEWKYYKNNKLLEQRMYHTNTKYDYIKYYENGNLEEKGTRDSFLYVGVLKKWYENGQLKMEENYADGRKEGNYKEWYENGQLKCEGNYADGEKIGTWKEYDNVKNDESKKSQKEATTNKGFFSGIKSKVKMIRRSKEKEEEYEL